MRLGEIAKWSPDKINEFQTYDDNYEGKKVGIQQQRTSLVVINNLPINI